MAKWRIYYDDKSSFSSEDGEPWDAPRAGVQVICQEENTDKGWSALYNASTTSGYYCWHEGTERWMVCDNGGFWDYMMMGNHRTTVIFGRTMPRSEDFWDVIKFATDRGLG